MNITKIRDKVVAKTTSLFDSGVKKVKTANIAQDVQKSSADIARTLNALSENAKAGLLKAKNSLLKATADYEAMKKIDAQKALEKHEKTLSKVLDDYRFEAYVNEGLASGLNKMEAEKGAHALMDATGEFAHKSASDSAEIIDNAPEILLQARKEQLYRDYGAKLKK